MSEKTIEDAGRPISEETLAAIEGRAGAVWSRAAAATPGPWKAEACGDVNAFDGEYVVLFTTGGDSTELDENNARFIASAREDQPIIAADAYALVAEVRRLRRHAVDVSMQEIADRASRFAPEKPPTVAMVLEELGNLVPFAMKESYAAEDFRPCLRSRLIDVAGWALACIRVLDEVAVAEGKAEK